MRNLTLLTKQTPGLGNVAQRWLDHYNVKLEHERASSNQRVSELESRLDKLAAAMPPTCMDQDCCERKY
jgi:hypothetical protein